MSNIRILRIRSRSIAYGLMVFIYWILICDAYKYLDNTLITMNLTGGISIGDLFISLYRGCESVQNISRAKVSIPVSSVIQQIVPILCTLYLWTTLRSGFNTQLILKTRTWKNNIIIEILGVYRIICFLALVQMVEMILFSAMQGVDIRYSINEALWKGIYGFVPDAFLELPMIWIMIMVYQSLSAVITYMLAVAIGEKGTLISEITYVIVCLFYCSPILLGNYIMLLRIDALHCNGTGVKLMSRVMGFLLLVSTISAYYIRYRSVEKGRWLEYD